MSPKRTPRGQTPPPNTVHGLLKPPKLEPGREAGDELDALHGGSHESRIARYRRAIRRLEQLIADDLKLEKRVKNAQKAPLPGSGAEGARSSGISDPTGSAATSGRIKDPAERSWASAEEAMKDLWWADTHRIRAHRMTAADGVLAELGEDEVLEDDACTNCAKINEWSKRGEQPSVPKDSTLCTWCHQFQRDHDGILPTRALLRKHHGPKGRVTTRDVEKALRDSQPQKQPA